MKKPNMKYQYLTGLILTVLIWTAYTQAKDTIETATAYQAFETSSRDLVAFSSDGNTFASVDSDGQIILWDVSSGQMRVTLPSQFVSPIKRIAFSPNGNTLAIVSESSIRLWNFVSGNIHLFLPESAVIIDQAFSPDGKILATVGQDARITLWDSQSGSTIQVLTGHQGSVNALALIQKVLTGRQNNIDALAFSPDGKTLATGGQDAQIKLWDIATGLEQASLSSKSHVTDLVFSPDGKTLAAVGQDARITLWDSQSGSTIQVLTGHQGSVNALALIPVLTDRQNNIDALAFSPDGKTLATGGQDAQIKLWDIATGLEQASLPSKSNVTDLVFSPDGKTLASLSESGPVSLWDVSSKLPQLLTGHKDSAIKVAFSSNQKALASVGATGKVIVWDLMTELERLSFDISVTIPESLTQTNRLAPASPATSALKLVSATTNSPTPATAAPEFDTMQTSTSEASDPCVTPSNPIVVENCKPGNPPTEWDVTGAGDPSIQGFATDISVNRGQTVFFKIDTDATNYRLNIYRMGYYGGDGARKITTVQPSVVLPQIQPVCLNEPTTGLVDCGNWKISTSWAIPADATSGIYFAKTIRTDTGGASHIVFIVRDDVGSSDLLYQTSDTTWQAYNDYGGNSLYVGSPAGRAYKVSYNRPFSTRGNEFKRAWLFGDEYPMVRWLEANGYDMSYFTGVDAERRGAEILEHKVFLSVGHDEYWSAGQRANVEAARNAGVHLAFFTGNEMYWKTRWEPSIDGSGTPNRTLVTYKETEANAKIDPLPNIWTGTWRDPRFSPPADGGRPENQLTGTIFTVNCCQDALSITVPEAYSKLRFWRNTSIQALTPGQVTALPRGVLGYEWDEALDNGFAPAGLTRMSSTTVSLGKEWYLLDYGLIYGSGTATHSLTLYRHSSGALVFSSGTNRWSWGLDGHHDFDSAAPSASTTPDVRMQQATVNLFADMGTQPQSLQSGLVAASQSTDTIHPVSTVTSPAAGSTVQSGSSVTITGTAADTGGGVVGGVEISVDDGITWHPATGRENWSYTWKPSSSGLVKLKSRSVDDSGNLESPGAGINVTVNGSPRTTGNAIAVSDQVLPN